MNLENIETNLVGLRQLASKVEFALSFQPSISSNTKDLQTLPDKLKLLLKRKESLTNKKNRLVNLVGRLSTTIQKSKDNLLVRLISNMIDIKNHVLSNNLTACPVCSSIPKEELALSIEGNILSYTAKVEEDTFYVNKSISLEKKVKNTLQKTEENIDEITRQITITSLKIERLKDENKSYISNELYSEELINLSLAVLDSNLNELTKKINLHQKIIEIIIQFNNLSRRLESEEIIKFNIDKVRDEKEINGSINRLNRASERITLCLENLEGDLTELHIMIQDNELMKKQLANYITKEQYEIPIINILNNEKSLIANYEKKDKNISSVHKILYAIKNNQEIELQIKELEDEIKSLSNKKELINNVADALKKHMSKMFHSFDTDAKDYLNDAASPIQKYYRYLNPMPSNSLIHFDGADEKLLISVLFENETNKSNAKNILSSGQLNVLAISIFLAINEGQNVHALDFIAIDDPIQNMDDVNQYSICDVLGQVNKQLIFSTHDLDFVRLFLKKNEHKKDEIQVFNFTSPYLNQEKIQKVGYK